ncbi:MAG: hypothetical protein Q9174_000546 [Haloplaca sp. 1 TL-2023]
MSPPRDIPALPSEVLMIAESQWIFSENELLRTPSILDGLTPEKERENRGKGVNFILQVGMMLKLPQVTLSTASVLLHRFFMRHSMVETHGRPGFHYYSMAATSIYLATKVEENCRKMKDLVVACVKVAQKDATKLVDEQDKEYWRWRDNILHNEDVLLEALCFDLTLEPPYKILFEYLNYFEVNGNRRLRNSAWAFINDSCLTTLCLQYPSRTIAASALYAAAKHCHTDISDDEYGRPWWEAIGVDIKAIKRACNYLATVYENAHVKNGRDVSIHQKTPENDDESTTKTRGTSDRLTSRSSTSGRDPAFGAEGVSIDGLNTNGLSRKRALSSTEMHQDDDARDTINERSRRGRSNEKGEAIGLADGARSIQMNGTSPDRMISPHGQANGATPDNISEEGELVS